MQTVLFVKKSSWNTFQLLAQMLNFNGKSEVHVSFNHIRSLPSKCFLLPKAFRKQFTIHKSKPQELKTSDDYHPFNFKQDTSSSLSMHQPIDILFNTNFQVHQVEIMYIFIRVHGLVKEEQLIGLQNVFEPLFQLMLKFYLSKAEVPEHSFQFEQDILQFGTINMML